MRLGVVLAVLCLAAFAAGDRRPDHRENGQRQQRHDSERSHSPAAERHQHQHDDKKKTFQRQQHQHQHEESDGWHNVERTFSHLTERDGASSWQHSHRRGRPDAPAGGHGPAGRRAEDGRNGGRQDDHRRSEHRRREDDGRTEKHTDRHAERHGDGYTERSIDRHTDQGENRHNDRHADKRHGHSQQHASGTRHHQNGGSEAHRRGDLHRVSQAEPARERGPAPASPQPPAAPQSAADEPATDEPVANEVSVDEPAANELAVDEPAVALGSDVEAAPAIVPPPHDQVAAMARYVVHVSDWTAMATISSREPTRGMPFANVFSVADGTRYHSTGVPYLYLTGMEISVKDLRVDNNASLTMSLAQTSFCQKHDYDPEDPLCAHVILSGRVLQVDPDEPEYTFARDALFARHPEMPDWPVGHNWFVAKLDIMNIIVLDFFGGAKTVSMDDYFAADPFKIDPRLVNRV